jgi:hypothetical protein
MADVTWQFNTVQENAKSEATRKHVIRNLAKTQAFLFSIKCWRSDKIALRRFTNHGTTSKLKSKWQDSANAKKYISDLVTGIQPKFDNEVAELQKLKAADTNDQRQNRHMDGVTTQPAEQTKIRRR